MIQELKNFVEHISEDGEEVFSKNLKLRPGVYVLLDIEKQGDEYALLNEKEIFETEEDILFFDGKNEVDNPILYNDFLFKQTNSLVVGNGKNKSFNSSSGVFMFNSVPFAIGLKKGKYLDLMANDREKLDKSIRTYFKSARTYEITKQDQLNWTDSMQFFCEQKLLGLIPQIPYYDQVKNTDFIFFFLKKPSHEDFVERHEAYLNAKVFNDSSLNEELGGELLGISDNLSGFNQKKPFLKHYTAPLEHNYRINVENAIKIWKFFQLKANRQIPNPTPIFIDERELNKKSVAVFQEETNGKISHSQLIKNLLSYSKRDLQNYYLLYFEKGEVSDIDFVSHFKYEEGDAKIIEVFSLGGSQAKKKVENVFDLEAHVFNTALNKKLIWGQRMQYFGDIEAHKVGDTTYNLLLKYRKAIYDFVYKSRRSGFTASMFDDMMTQAILDDIRHDENKNGDHSKEYFIKEKLNIWFSLYDFFINTTSKPRQNMANQTEELLKRLKEICSKDNEEHIHDDPTFAFAVGQIIHYLLKQSESGNRTHALLEPFLQKTDVKQLKIAIARTFDTYKHAITFYRTKYEFDKIMSEVMGYEPHEKNMKNLLPTILAGYFSKSIMDKTKVDNA